MDNQTLILEYKKKIITLKEKNKRAKEMIKKSESACVQISKKIQRTESIYNDRLSKIRYIGSKIPTGSNFNDIYYNKMKSILFGNKTDQALGSLKSLKSKILKKIDEYEEEIRINTMKINQYNQKIIELNRKIMDMEKAGENNV